MNILMVFDDFFVYNNSVSNTSIDLFPLTSNFLTIQKIKHALTKHQAVTINKLDAAKCIDDEVNQLQKSIHIWSCKLGNLKIAGKKIKEWFILPDHAGSAWWFGLIAEKNAVQDDAFFKIARLNAFTKHISDKKYDACVIAIQNRIEKKMYRAAAISLKMKVTCIASFDINKKKNVKSKLFVRIKNAGLMGALSFALIHWLIWIKEHWLAKRYLPPLKKRLLHYHPFLFVSYFPNIDKEEAAEGRFRNKYALALQDKLKELNVPISWMLMPVYYDGHDFRSAMQWANTFNAQGENIFVLQEFFSFKVLIKSFAWWLRQSILAYMLYWRIRKEDFISQLTTYEALPIVNYLWWHSLVGTSGVRGIIFYLTYLEIFKSLPAVKTCLYYCEMQAWEKALILAKNHSHPSIKTLAYQHTVVMKNYFNYFYDKEEMERTAKITDLPIPDVLIANGKIPYALLAESQFPNLCAAEAIRQLYLSTRAPIGRKHTKPILLVVGSYDKIETISLISMIYTAFPKPHNFCIWFKGSPVNPIAPLFAELQIDIKQTNYQIVYQDIADLLKQVDMTLVANTTVAIEAAACGLNVIVPLFSDTMLMNPIVQTQAEYTLVSSVEALKATIETQLKQAHLLKRATWSIHAYWNLDITMPLWTNLLRHTMQND